MKLRPISFMRTLVAVCILGAFGLAGPFSAVFANEQASAMLAFPGAEGWAKHTPGGRGGKIIKVTNLKADGPGSLVAALGAAGPRIVVFEVGGVIDLGATEFKITSPFVTIAGQTAPSPGITIIRGGLTIATHDVVLQHLRIRPGEGGHAKRSGHDIDAVTTTAGAYNVIVDHCSLTWATDENMSASGPRFTGDSLEDWHKGTSHKITFSHNLVAEGLSHSTHAKGEHSKGSLIHDNVSDILIYANLYAHNYERNPLFKGGVRGAVVNNFIYNPGQRGIHYNLQGLEWGKVAPVNGHLTAVGNVLRAGPDTPTPSSFLMIGGVGDLDYYSKDNVAVDRIGEPIQEVGHYTVGGGKVLKAKKPLDWPAGLKAKSSGEVETWVLATVGARPWDRDYNDTRILADVAEGRGEIIDSEQEVGGYPQMKETHRTFDAELWNLQDMTPRSAEALDSGSKAKGT
ncbi:pectate lyase family protein [Kordiimonas aestuarii]|uniref:pectate lyase family protein n=1 Tax=Kordiimonas aestuarii TaxID=1005925 RepID=UPI0021D2E10D|nr:pectate lyase [Kordiimonas aestuarii]